MYYVNSFFLYSLFGFILESDVYKITGSKRHSGVFYGPIATVYGFGVVILILLKKYIFDKLKCNKVLKFILVYLSCVFVLSLIEYFGGVILNSLFGIDMWNYEKKDYNMGKYVCLELSLIWGAFGVLYLYFFKSFTDKIIKLIPKWVSYVWIFLFFIDCVVVVLTK